MCLILYILIVKIYFLSKAKLPENQCEKCFMFSMLLLQMSAYEPREGRPAGDPQGQNEDWSQPR